MKKGFVALLITYLVASFLDRLAFLFGLLAGGAVGAFGMYLLLHR